MSVPSFALVRKNVLQLVPSFHQGGSERQALQLARLLRNEGTYNVRLAALEKSGVLLDEAVASGFGDVPEFPLSSFYDRNTVAQVRRLAAYLRKHNISLVQTHDFYTNIFGMMSSRIADVPVRIAAKRETGMRGPAQRMIERQAFRLAHRVVVNSIRVRDHLADWGVPARRMELIHNGIDHERFASGENERTGLRRTLGLPCNPALQLVTIVANLREPVKNHEMFLRAARQVSSTSGAVEFVVAGEGERTRLITKFARDLGIERRVHFLGRCTRVPELLHASDVCVLTSNSEGFSNSILEYMAAGRPVIATDVGGADEAIEENETGFLVPVNDDRMLAERLVQVLTDKCLRERLGRNGRSRVVEKFSAEAQLEATLAMYDRELSRV